MTKTYYSVKYGVWGASAPRIAWFDDKAAANEFAAADYRDTPTAHHCSNPETIEKYNELVAITKDDLAIEAAHWL